MGIKDSLPDFVFQLFFFVLGFMFWFALKLLVHRKPCVLTMVSQTQQELRKVQSDLRGLKSDLQQFNSRFHKLDSSLDPRFNHFRSKIRSDLDLLLETKLHRILESFLNKDKPGASTGEPNAQVAPLHGFRDPTRGKAPMAKPIVGLQPGRGTGSSDWYRGLLGPHPSVGIRIGPGRHTDPLGTGSGLRVNLPVRPKIPTPVQVPCSNPSRTLQCTCVDKLREELSCAICLDICFEPITTPCGHSFCKKCLRSAADKCGNRCPKCRQPISNGISCSVNTVLWNTIQLLFPKEVSEARKAAAGALK
ncbi:hypothetical protein HRI_000378400 [Hibiscus trionum]|uniref:RING-type E3 ubiquitin transferase n=1 Tax=Hibiscus trionum TaxID=183268 RepID=A0A9W7GZX1_HIBTR|nr:hypothetical protein HRI_000378400 [Hibiscus trionum]